MLLGCELLVFKGELVPLNFIVKGFESVLSGGGGGGGSEGGGWSGGGGGGAMLLPGSGGGGGGTAINLPGVAIGLNPPLGGPSLC